MTLLLLLALLAAPAQAHRTGEARTEAQPAACGDTLAYQVLLDRRGFSPGEIDGKEGPNLQRALRAYQAEVHLPETGVPNCDAWNQLTRDAGTDVLADYQLTEQDLRGPFLDGPLPNELVDQARLPALAYQSITEAVAERFHSSPQLLSRLNPGVRLESGTTIRVPAVTVFDPTRKPVADTSAANVTIEVSRGNNSLRASRADGTLIFFAPVSSGSEHDPLPIGTWKVTGTSWLPPFHYNPKLFWDAESGDSKATIQPGPNNPVGVVWVDINVPHYGLHGTPSPNLVGHAQSHGCVRLTNWDAARLASLVKPGTRVVFVE